MRFLLLQASTIEIDDRLIPVFGVIGLALIFALVLAL